VRKKQANQAKPCGEMTRKPLWSTDTNSLDGIFADPSAMSPKQRRLSEISNRAYGMGLIFELNQECIDWEKLEGATTAQDIQVALGNVSEAYGNRLPSNDFLLTVVRERTFPKARRKAQIRFLAKSCATFGDTTPRRSRDLCEEANRLEQNKAKGQIIRQEFYVECTCGYSGPACDGGCPSCGARLRRE
jgi:hypothetical protein